MMRGGWDRNVAPRMKAEAKPRKCKAKSALLLPPNTRWSLVFLPANELIRTKLATVPEGAEAFLKTLSEIEVTKAPPPEGENTDPQQKGTVQ
jgi:hypothetical protein